MEWLKSKATIIGGGLCLTLIGLQAYGVKSMRISMDERVSSLERQLESVRSEDNTKLMQLSGDLDIVTKKMGINAEELQRAHTLAEQLKQENAQTAQRLRRELAAKADSKAVLALHEEANNKLSETATKLTEVQQEASTKIAGVSGDVQLVRSDLNATREDLASNKRDINSLNSLIARNSTELAELRKKGERDYIEFDLRKGKKLERVGDVLLQLTKTDLKRQKFDVTINADDASIIKKDRTANEPITFLVGRDRLRYELVVNYVNKDQIKGYISTPKDKVLSAEAPSLRRLP